MADQVTNYKCPACTGPLHFKGNSGKMECDYCGSIFDVAEIEKMYAQASEEAVEAKEEADAKAAKQQEEADEWTITDEQMDAKGMKSYTCPSCGAELVCEETTAATSCPYCGNTTIVPGQFSGMLQPDYVIPFKYEKPQALDALKKHYGKRFLLPKTFKDENHLEEVKGVYVPFWLYDGTAAGSCTFEASNTNTHTEGNTEVTIKEIYRADRSGKLAFEKIPVDASTHMDDDLMDSIEPYNYKEIQPFAKANMSGYLADKYDVSAEENAKRAISRAKESTKQALRNDVTGYDSVIEKSGNVKVEQGKVSYAMMPVWLLHTKWNDKDFMFAMNGQTGKMVGDLPVDTMKLALTTILTAAVVFLICNFLMGLDTIACLIGAVIIAAVVAFVLFNSMKSVAKATSANAYIKKESVKITYRKDTFIRRDVSRRKIDNGK